MSKRITARAVRLKRAYEPASRQDGTRVLVDRLWPRGVARDEAGIDEWMKEVAPSAELRKWFGHEPGRWRSFRRRYESELKRNPEPLEHLKSLARRGVVTLVYSARDEAHNNAVVLRDMLLGA